MDQQGKPGCKELAPTRQSLRMGRQEEKRLLSMTSSVCFHGDGSGSGSELSQWKQTVAPIHHHPSHAGHTGRCAIWTQRNLGRDVGSRAAASLSSVSCWEGSRGVSEAASEGQSWKSRGHAGPFLIMCWRHRDQPPSRTGAWEPPASPMSPGWQHKGSGPFHSHH